MTQASNKLTRSQCFHTAISAPAPALESGRELLGQPTGAVSQADLPNDRYESISDGAAFHIGWESRPTASMVEINRPPPETEDERHEEELRERGRKAFHDGEYVEAFSCFQSSALDMALRWFREEGVTFHRPHKNQTPLELLIGLAIAANEELAARGEEPPHKLSTATWLFNAVAELRIALEKEIPANPESIGMKIAEMTSRGVMLGQIDMIMTAVRLGWFDKLAEYEIGRERRRAGAQKVNAAKATVKERALGEAIRIAGRNPTLSNEDLARKVVEAAGLNTTIRTATDWVREWRRREMLRPQSPT